MRLSICIALVAVIATAPAIASAKTTKAPAFQLNETSWTYVDPDKKVKARRVGRRQRQLHRECRQR